MKTPWFIRVGWFYWPISTPGFVATFFVLAFVVQVFIAVDRKSHSGSDTLYGIFPFLDLRVSFVRLAGRSHHHHTQSMI